MSPRSLLMIALLALPTSARAATKVACVGDSITRGAGTTIGGYSTLLAKLLGSDYQVGKFGNSGSTMMKTPTDSYWVAPEFAQAKAFAPNIVVIMLGTNDAKGSWTSADGAHHFEPDYRAMVAEFAALPSKPRFVLVWPPPMIRPTLTAGEGILKTQVNPIISRIAADTGSPVAKVHDAFLPDPTRYFGDSMGNIADGLHPNDAGAMRIAETVFCAIVPTGAKCAGAPPPRDAGADALLRDAGADAGADAELAHADAHADADGEDTVGPDARAEPDAAAGPKDTAPATGGQGGQGAPKPEPKPEPEPEPDPKPAKSRARGCQFGAEPAPVSALAVIAVALIIRRRPRG